MNAPAADNAPLQRPPKRVFGIVYLIVMTWTLWQLGESLLHEVDPGLLRAFAGESNVQTARVFVCAFIVAALVYLLFAYVVMECFEERVAFLSQSKGPSANSSSVLTSLEYCFRFLLVFTVVLYVKYPGIQTYQEALRTVALLSGLYASWTLALMPAWSIFRWYDMAISSVIALLTFSSMRIADDPGSEARLGLALLMVLAVTTAVIVGFILHWLKENYQLLKHAVSNYVHG